MDEPTRNCLFGFGYSKKEIDRIEMDAAAARTDAINDLSGDDPDDFSEDD